MFSFPKPLSRVLEKHQRKLAEARHWQIVRNEVLWRDGYACRVKGTGFGACAGRMEVHHMKPRSLGRDDSRENLITLCASHHADCQAYRLFADAQTKHGADGAIVWSIGT